LAGLLAATFLLGAARAMAADPDSDAPAVCAPPCPAGQVCIGDRCVPAGPQRQAPPRAPAAPPPAAPPAGASYMTQTGNVPLVASPTSPTPPPVYAPPAPYAPPPGYAPPRGYYPPPGYYPPTPVLAAPVRPPRQKRIFLAMPFLGAHSYQHSEARNTSPGLRLGSFFGGRITDTTSLNAELRIDVTNANADPSGYDLSQYLIGLAFSPLWQLPTGTVDLVLGPKLGMFQSRTRATYAASAAEAKATGYFGGVNFGLFFPASPRTSFGAMLSLELEQTQRVCSTSAGFNICGSNADTGIVVGLTAAALF